jgi:hypothetical protein
MTETAENREAMTWLDELILQADAEAKEGFSKPLIITAGEAAKLKLLRDVVRAAEGLRNESDGAAKGSEAAKTLKAALAAYHAAES